MPSPKQAPHSDDKRVMVIVNTKSRRGRDWLRPVNTYFKDSGLEMAGFHAIKDGKKLGPMIRAAAKDRVGLIVVGGGDGSLSTAASEMHGSGSTLGILPMGTGNALARDLGIPSDPLKACEIITSGRAVSIDLGTANDDLFVNVASVGLTTAIAMQLTNDAKRKLGRMVYAFALMKALVLVRPYEAKLTTPVGEDCFKTLQVVIGNGRFHAGPFLLSPTASITDGKLEIYALEGTNRASFLKMALHMRGGHQVDLPEVRAYSVSEGSLVTRPIKHVTIDGEIVRRTPLKFRSLKGALPVMAPVDFGS